MKIAIDANELAISQNTGVKVYTKEIIKALAGIDKENEYLLYLGEKCDNLYCVPVEMGWSDVGSWDELMQMQSSGHEFLANKAFHVCAEAQNNFVFSEAPQKIAMIGVENLIVVNTPEAILVCKSGQGEKVKEVIEAKSEESINSPLYEERPWGSYTVIKDEPLFKLKSIRVKPGQRLSYQSHKQRSETWTVVRGLAEVTLNDKPLRLEKGQSVSILAGDKHRMKNIGDTDMEFIEVQTGSYFGEDDIVRYEDDFGRA